jgi:hypothetical protein
MTAAGPRSPRTPGSAGAASKALGEAALRTRRAFVRRIRRNIAIGGVCLFLASWLLIFGVLVSGHDLALGRAHRSSSNAAKSTSSHTEVGKTETAATSNASSEPETDSAEEASQSSEENAATTMTTRQS